MSAPRRKLAVVAREAGVSISTVSKVLRAYPDVAPSTRARVRDALRRAGYTLESGATSNRRDESTLVDVYLSAYEIPCVMVHAGTERSLPDILAAILDGRPFSRAC